MSTAEPLLYDDRAFRYLAQRGVLYDRRRMSVDLLTPPQRRRALRKERRGWRRLAAARST